MQLIKFKNIETTKVVTLDFELRVLRSDGRELFIKDNAVFALLNYIFTTNESVFRYNLIGSIIKEKKAIHRVDNCSDSVIANKYMFKIRTILKGLMVEDFITTIRGLGYKVSDKWLKIQENNHINHKNDIFINEIDHIINNCITYSESAHITKDKSGLCFIKPEHDVVMSHFERVNNCYHLFLKLYSSPGNSIELINLREKIMKLLLYAIYWRVGDSLTNEKFRSDYKNELLVLSKQIKQAVILFD